MCWSRVGTEVCWNIAVTKSNKEVHNNLLAFPMISMANLKPVTKIYIIWLITQEPQEKLCHDNADWLMAPQEQRVLNPPVVTILSSDSKAADREVVLSNLFKAIQKECKYATLASRLVHMVRNIKYKKGIKCPRGIWERAERGVLSGSTEKICSRYGALWQFQHASLGSGHGG